MAAPIKGFAARAGLRVLRVRRSTVARRLRNSRGWGRGQILKFHKALTPAAQLGHDSAGNSLNRRARSPWLSVQSVVRRSGLRISSQDCAETAKRRKRNENEKSNSAVPPRKR